MAKEKIKVKTETTAEAYVVEVLEPKIDTIQEDINQTKLDQKTTLATMITFTESMNQSFEEMKNTKAAAIPVSVCKKEDVKSVIKEQIKESLTEIDRKSVV